MQGLKMKYFVLKPEGDSVHASASRCAMLKYAEVIEAENPEFAEDLRLWVDLEETTASNSLPTTTSVNIDN